MNDPMGGRFRFLEDVALADAAFEASGATPSQLCSAAARALIETMADPDTVGSSWRRTVERDAASLADLLFDWLSDIVYYKDAAGVVFHSAEADVEEDRQGSRWRLRAALAGAPVDPSRQVLRADVKAVTKHLYEVTRAGAEWRARVVLDI
jgi:SHS2 domain-containing protein